MEPRGILQVEEMLQVIVKCAHGHGWHEERTTLDP